MYEDNKLIKALYDDAMDALFPKGEPVVDVDGTKVYIEDHKAGVAIRVNPWNSEYSGVVGYGQAYPLQIAENGKTLVFLDPWKAAEYLTNLKEYLEKIAKNRQQVQIASALRKGNEATVEYLGGNVVVEAVRFSQYPRVSVSGLDPEMASVIVGFSTFVIPGLKAKEIVVSETTHGWVVTSYFAEAMSAARFYTEVTQ